MVTLKSGVNSLTLDLEGEEIQDAIHDYGATLNIPSGAKAFVAGRQVAETYVLEDGDEVVFQAATAEKGA